MKNKITFENSVSHEFTKEELFMLVHYIRKSYEEDIIGEGNEIVDTGTFMKSEQYQKLSKLAKATVSLYHLFYEMLD
ncbi:MAG: hypothetical protein IJN85_04825 [Oscillospiraceae bacterium]|nr:hypothetical protein [Oscillospiraceae bacterium]